MVHTVGLVTDSSLKEGRNLNRTVEKEIQRETLSGYQIMSKFEVSSLSETMFKQNIYSGPKRIWTF